MISDIKQMMLLRKVNLNIMESSLWAEINRLLNGSL